ncbi:hypothetical protein Tco_0669583, partial [Tanacetum coccineum]
DGGWEEMVEWWLMAVVVWRWDEGDGGDEVAVEMMTE